LAVITEVLVDHFHAVLSLSTLISHIASFQETISSWFPMDNQIPSIAQRVIRLQELGQVLQSGMHSICCTLN
jgi:hypothetical protein